MCQNAVLCGNGLLISHLLSANNATTTYKKPVQLVAISNYLSPNDKFQALPKSKFKLMKMAESSPKPIEDTVGKGEIALYEQFLLFPQCFQKISLQSRKTRACLVKGFKFL